MPPQAPTWDDVDKAPAAAGAGAAPVWPVDSGDTIKQKMAQPTQFERERASDSATPWSDVAKGAGERVLDYTSGIGSEIRAHAPWGEHIIPAEGLAAEQKIAAGRGTPGEALGKNEVDTVAGGLATGGAFDVAGTAPARAALRPVAQFAEENLVPAAKSIPYLGRGVEAAEQAPTAIKAAIRGGTTGAGVGAVEEGIRSHGDPLAIAKGAAYGGIGGAASGAGLYKLHELAQPEVVKDLVPWEAFDTSKAERAVTPFEGVGSPPASPSVRRGPGQIAPEVVGSGPDRIPQAATDQGEAVLPGGATMRRPTALLTAGAPEEAAGIQTAKPIDQLGDLIKRQGGWEPPKPDVPLRDQLTSPLPANITYSTDSNGTRWASTPDSPAKVSVPKSMTDPKELENYLREKFDLQKNFGGATTFRRPPLVRDAEFIGGERAKAPESFPTVATEEPARQMGGGPLRPGVALKDQPKYSEAPVRSNQTRLEEKYPDKAVRQLVHANGEDMVDAIGEDKDLLKQVHDLTNPEVRQARINAGHDMGQTIVSNRKAMGSGAVNRQDSFKALLDAGFTPKDIVRLAKSPLRP